MSVARASPGGEGGCPLPHGRARLTQGARESIQGTGLNDPSAQKLAFHILKKLVLAWQPQATVPPGWHDCVYRQIIPVAFTRLLQPPAPWSDVVSLGALWRGPLGRGLLGTRVYSSFSRLLSRHSRYSRQSHTCARVLPSIYVCD